MSATNPHDAYFREVFSSPPRLAGLLRSLLPAGAADKLDLDALTLLPQRFVDPSLDDHEADLLAQVPLRGLPGEVAYLRLSTAFHPTISGRSG